MKGAKFLAGFGIPIFWFLFLWMRGGTIFSAFQQIGEAMVTMRTRGTLHIHRFDSRSALSSSISQETERHGYISADKTEFRFANCP